MLRTVTILTLAFLLLPANLQAQNVVELQAEKDNTLYEDSGGNFSNGVGQYLFAGKTNLGELRRAVVAFDLSGVLPDGATVDSVQFQLTMNKSRGTTHFVHLHRITQDWGEGTSDADGQEGIGGDAAEGDATWMHAFRPSTFWTRAGGDFKTLESASIAVSSVGSAIWYNSADLLNDVQHWLDNPAENFGWLVMGDEIVDASAQRFASRENPTESARPAMRIYYSVNATYVEEQATPESLRLTAAWPNPFSSSATITVENKNAGSIQIQVINLQGQVVHESSRWSPTGSTDLSIDGSDWTPGIYMVRITSEGGSKTAPLVLLR
jgi:hypothetical protein